MKKISYTIFIVLITITNVLSQNTENLSSFLIPAELIEDANAVVRLNRTIINVEAIDKLVVREKRIITVLNKLGKTHVNAYKHYDNDTKITKLTATIIDATGKKIKKYSKSNFEDVSAIDGGTLYSDSRVKYLEYTPTSYPYTVVIESEYKNSSTGFIPKWFPIENYYLAIEKSEYILNNPQNISFRVREKNLEKYPITDSSVNNNLYYILTNQKAIKPEYYSLNYDEIAPNVSISLNSFSLKGVNGNAKNWKEFGLWMYNSLIKDRNQLSTATVSKISNLVKDIEDPVEKAKIVYKYVQEKTRYISVQVDIGGWEPIPANKVDQVSYGDCKGLTNYTKALLDAVGIESHHTIVYANNKKDIDSDFTSIQGNHMILNIPNNGNDIWLECTSQTAPFGFLGDFTDDRDVLVITPEGGVIKHTPRYINEDNLQLTKAAINLKPNGDLSATFKRTSYGIQYDDKYHIEKKTEKELIKYYKDNVWDYNNNLEVSNIKHTNDKDKVEFKEVIDMTIDDYASVRDSSYIFKLNSFNRITGIPKKYRNRQQPLEINRGFVDKDEFTYKIPAGYTFTSLPQKKTIKNKFGSYYLEIEKLDNTTFKYKREFSLLKGIHPKEDYKAYRKFRKTVTKYDNLRIELIKQ